ncbi:unnamed protein product [Ilex paraguariensis]|uniref:Uncharacterized protein n=1 Tax=Ilex paraguariensis TaxID=185542 RepID=A0ABC8U546_9AQUA
MPKSRGMSQQQGNNRIQNGSYSSNLAKGIPAILDEFKYGFPSYGLSTSSCRWWGSHSSDGSIHGNGGEDVGENNRQSNELVDEACELLSMDTERSASGADGSNFSHQGMGSLLAVRKRAADEGREALKLGVYRGYGVNKLAKRERMLLRRIFESFSRF